MKKASLILLRIVVASIALFPFATAFDEYYSWVILEAAPLELNQVNFISSRPLLSLMILIIAIPGPKMGRKALFCLAGVGTFLLADILMTRLYGNFPFTASKKHAPSDLEMWSSLMWHMSTRWLFPIVLLLLAAKEQVGSWLVSKNTRGDEKGDRLLY